MGAIKRQKMRPNVIVNLTYVTEFTFNCNN